MVNFEVIGYIAGATIAASLSPQIIKSWKSKSTKDISIAWTMIYMTGLLLWVIYGVGIKSYPITAMMSVELVMATSLFVLKTIYK